MRLYSRSAPETTVVVVDVAPLEHLIGCYLVFVSMSTNKIRINVCILLSIMIFYNTSKTFSLHSGTSLELLAVKDYVHNVYWHKQLLLM